jgi:hypothetical protein
VLRFKPYPVGNLLKPVVTNSLFVIINYLCTYDLYGPVRKLFDAGG